MYIYGLFFVLHRRYDPQHFFQLLDQLHAFTSGSSIKQLLLIEPSDMLVDVGRGPGCSCRLWGRKGM
jgi:hypothetical protein